jgi:hypothetical protein
MAMLSPSAAKRRQLVRGFEMEAIIQQPETQSPAGEGTRFSILRRLARAARFVSSIRKTCTLRWQTAPRPDQRRRTGQGP